MRAEGVAPRHNVPLPDPDMWPRHTQKSKVKGSGRKDDAFIVDDDDTMSEAEEGEGGEREYVVVDGNDSDKDDGPIGMAALEQITAKRKVQDWKAPWHDFMPDLRSDRDTRADNPAITWF